jgi:hypothetical protein
MYNMCQGNHLFGLNKNVHVMLVYVMSSLPYLNIPSFVSLKSMLGSCRILSFDQITIRHAKFLNALKCDALFILLV